MSVLPCNVISKQDAGTSTDDSDFDKVEKSSDIPVRRNAYGQIKTSHNVKRIKPPLPPMKKTPKAPLRRSARNQAKMSQEVTSYYIEKSIRKKYSQHFFNRNKITWFISLRDKYSYFILYVGSM